MKKRKYLYHLAISVFFIILLPTFIFIVFFGKYSYEKVEAANKEYQDALMEHYMAQLDRMVMELKEHAAQVSAASREKTSVFWEKDPTNNYWYYQAINELITQHNNFPSDYFGIYYYDDGCIVTGKAKLTVADYFMSLDIKDPNEEKYLKDLFSEKQYQEFMMNVGGTEKQAKGKNRFFIGFYTTLGRQRDKVMLLYEYTEADIERIFESSFIEVGFEGSLWNKLNGFSFFFGNYNEKGYKDTVKNMIVFDEFTDQSPFLVKESKIHSIILVGYMNENSPGNMTLAFWDNMLVAVAIVMIIVLLGYLLTLYIAYKPIFHLTKKLKHPEGNELEAISKALDERSAKIEEQEMLLLDLLLNNLLYKAPVSNEKIKQLGIEPTECYTVFLLDGYVLVDAESKRMILEAEQQFQAKMFVTDLEGGRRSIFVLFLNAGLGEGIEEWLIQQCKNLGDGSLKPIGGKMVQDIKDIWRCLSFCEEELKKDMSIVENPIDVQQSNSSRKQKSIELREEILLYVDEHYRDINLNQVSMADHFNISTYTLSRIFRNDVGIGFVTYVNAKRVEYAKELLLTTKENVHDIAMKSGFDNDNNFFKVFKANTGMSPTTFRES